MATTTAAANLTAGDTLIGAIEGTVLEATIVLDSPFDPEGYVDVLVAYPRPTPQGATQRWESFQLDEQVRIA